MAKQTSTPAKKASVKKTAKPVSAKQKSAPAKKAGVKKTVAAKKATGKARSNRADNIIEYANGIIQHTLDEFAKGINIDTNLSQKEINRLFSAGIRNYGFIDKAQDTIIANPDFIPPMFDLEQMRENLRTLELLRQLAVLLDEFRRIVHICILVMGNSLYRDALSIYDNLKAMAKRNIPGAEAMLAELSDFFRRRRRTGEQEPTVKKIEKDIHSLLKGTVDGKVIIENERPEVSKGVRKVVDDVHRGKALIKESAKVEIEE